MNDLEGIPMFDRDTVIKGLYYCSNDCSWVCPYFDTDGCITLLAMDAFSLLKEQEPVQPEREYSGGGTTWWNVCGACRTAINPNDKYCHECGREVKWND